MHFGVIQGDSGENISILGGDCLGHREKKKFHMSMCLILNAYPARDV
jgi:hypothetical protein